MFLLNSQRADRTPQIQADSERDCVERILRTARVGGKQIDRLNRMDLHPRRKSMIAGNAGRTGSLIGGFKSAMALAGRVLTLRLNNTTDHGLLPRRRDL